MGLRPGAENPVVAPREAIPSQQVTEPSPTKLVQVVIAQVLYKPLNE